MASRECAGFGPARAAGNHWREYECMLALATTEYELGLDDDVLRHAGDITAAAERMGEPQVPFADALVALVNLRLQRAGRPAPSPASAMATGSRAPAAPSTSSTAAVEASLAALRERDDKAHLAYALNEAAIAALADGDRVTARRHAEEALAAATAVRRPSQISRARATLASAAASPSRAARAR